MLDIFAVILPLFVLSLWVAAEARKSRLMERDKLKTGKIHINLKYLSLDLLSQASVTQQEDNTPSFPFTIPYPSVFSRWVGSQDYVLVFLAPLNLLTCAFFLVLYAIRNTKAELLPASAYFMLVIAYSLIACAAVHAMRVTCRHAESAMIVAVMGTLRALEYMAPLIISEGYELLIARAVLTTWGNFLTIYILTVLPREFLTEDKTKEAYIEEAFSEAGNAADKPPSVHSITRENIIVGLLLLCSLVTSVLVVVPDWHHKLYVMIGFEVSIFSSLSLGLVLALITVSFFIFHALFILSFDHSYIRKIKGLSQQGVFIGGINTRWLIMTVIIGGVLIRIIYDGAATLLSVYNETYVPITSSKAFASWWQETFTLIIPLSFLLSYIVIKATKGKADKSRNAFTHSKRIFCAYLLCLHLMAVGLFLETTKYSFTLSCAFVIALLVATNISLVLFKFVPPISYFCGRTVKSKVDI